VPAGCAAAGTGSDPPLDHRRGGRNGRVLQMRLARPSDKGRRRPVIDARCDWMEARELPSWRCARDDLMARWANPRGTCGSSMTRPRGDGADRRAAAGAGVGWTEAERAEPVLYLSGSLMAWWAVDLAAGRACPGSRTMG
jgi:hypothetical protein